MRLDEAIARLRPLLPGVAVSAVVALASLFLAEHYGAPVMLFALLLGMALNFLSGPGVCGPGIEFTARHVLRWGVALLGLKITVAQVQALGWQSAALVATAVCATVAFGLLMARWMGFQRFFGLLSGGAVGICGASAALALSAAFPNHPLKERATLFTVIGVSALSTLAMVIYPLGVRMLGLNPVEAGVFLGGTIHDVAQVVGAGYSMGKETGDAATVIKLMRVAMLVPVIVLASWMARSYFAAEAGSTGVAAPGKKPPLLPGFAVVFALLVAVNSVGWVPAPAAALGNDLSRVFLVAAMAAIGLKTHLKQVLSVGWKPIALMVLETLFLAGLVYTAIRFGMRV